MLKKIPRNDDARIHTLAYCLYKFDIGGILFAWFGVYEACEVTAKTYANKELQLIHV